MLNPKCEWLCFRERIRCFAASYCGGCFVQCAPETESGDRNRDDDSDYAVFAVYEPVRFHRWAAHDVCCVLSVVEGPAGGAICARRGRSQSPLPGVCDGRRDVCEPGSFGDAPFATETRGCSSAAWGWDGEGWRDQSGGVPDRSGGTYLHHPCLEDEAATGGSADEGCGAGDGAELMAGASLQVSESASQQVSRSAGQQVSESASQQVGE